jgi:hypothetical protein
MWRTATLVAMVVAGALVGSALAGRAGLDWTARSLAATQLPVRFVARPAGLLHQCERTARSVGYPVPCPSELPDGLVGTPVTAGPCRGYRFHLVGTPCTATGAAWRGWVVGSTQLGAGRSFQHLVIQVAPHPVGYAEAVNGPVVSAGERPEVGGLITIDGRQRRWLFVDPKTNPGSAFMGHVVLVWTQAGHTYAIGFHAVTTLTAAAALDYQLVRRLQLVGS